MGGAASLPHLQAEKIKWVMSIPAFKMLTEEKLESVASKVRTLVFWFMRDVREWGMLVVWLYTMKD